MVTYEAMSNASAQRAACREHKSRSVHVMAGLKPNVATCDEPQRTGPGVERAFYPGAFDASFWIACDPKLGRNSGAKSADDHGAERLFYPGSSTPDPAAA